jgi:hypothetical protein
MFICTVTNRKLARLLWKTGQKQETEYSNPFPFSHLLLSDINLAKKGKPGRRGREGKKSQRKLSQPPSRNFFFRSSPAPRILRRGGGRGGGRGGMGRDDRFPVWEAALGAGVAAVFAAGLVGVYLSMPDSDYSFLKLPHNLQELQILT